MGGPPLDNGSRFAERPLAGGGTPVDTWLTADRGVPALDLSGCGGLVLVGAHPDDETLGFGAGASLLARRGIRVQVVSATDGGRSHPDLDAQRQRRLEATRRDELRRAVGVLGLPPPISLGLPDGDVAAHEHRLTDLLTDVLADGAPGIWCAATWRGDGHPDHEAVGRAAAAAAAATGANLLEYPVWMWHWAVPDDPAVPWHRARAVVSDGADQERKSAAAQCFTSQFEPLDVGAEPALPPFVLHRLLQVGEVAFR
ncbi:LmbE family protein [Mycobacterium sp. 852013-51886_SCH5428379]|uniref:PIG-L deacetylase family protein n=1 Tax=Mycobacterium sp. 852013-51886_SCH5428379 TaxID=1834111 RepID=UPI0007FE7171|nr:PIG-L deacetylase family protein [Mycobacterium sp. 852013-51886_SCH5428379]OBB60218.1 LmbE family protein [Mycobacterium sp. 852013-51886_SCH5428379]